MPDGQQVRFPDDMPREQIRGMIASKFPDFANNKGLNLSEEKKSEIQARNEAYAQRQEENRPWVDKNPIARLGVATMQGIANAGLNPAGYVARAAGIDTKPLEAQTAGERVAELAGQYGFDAAAIVPTLGLAAGSVPAVAPYVAPLVEGGVPLALTGSTGSALLTGMIDPKNPYARMATDILGGGLGAGLTRPKFTAPKQDVKTVKELTKSIGEDALNRDIAEAERTGRNLLEVGGDEVMQAAQQARQQSPEARKIITDTLESSIAEQPTRTRGVINEALGTKGKNATIAQVMENAKAEAQPIYKELENIGDLAEYEIKDANNVLTKYDNPMDYSNKKIENFEKAKKQFLEDMEFDKNNEETIIQNLKQHQLNKEVAKKENIAKMMQYAEKAKNNPDAYYVKFADAYNITPDDIYSGRIKGIKNSKGVKYDTDEFYSQLGSPFPDTNVTSPALREEFSFKYQKPINGYRTKVDYKNPIAQDIESGFLANKGYEKPYIPNYQAYNGELKDIDTYDVIIDKEPIMKEIRNILKKDGWKPYHSSGKRVASSSSYYTNPKGETLRLSNHQLPDTPERVYNTEQGLRKGWDYEYVIDNPYTEMNYYLSPNADEFRKLFYYNSGIPMPGKPESQLANAIKNNDVLADTILRVKRANSSLKNLPDTDFKVVNEARKALSQASMNRTELSGYEARQALNELDPILNNITGGKLAQANKLYSDAYQFERAADLGRDVFNSRKSPDDLKTAWNSLSSTEKQAAKIGLREEVMNKIGSATNETNALNRFLPENVREKIMTIAGEKEGGRIIDEAEQAVKLRRNYNKLTSGSQTAEKQSLRDTLRGIRGFIRNPWESTVDAIAKPFDTQRNIRMAEYLTENPTSLKDAFGRVNMANRLNAERMPKRTPYLQSALRAIIEENN